MRRFFPAIVFYAVVLLLASCGKFPFFGSGNSSAIKLTVSGVDGSKASVITSYSIKEDGFNISAYVTETWNRDVIGGSPDISPGIYKDPGYYQGPYDESTYPVPAGIELKDIRVTYDGNRREDPWRIEGNEDYTNHKFSWVNGVAMNFFSYAPRSVSGRVITKADDSVDSNYPFNYTTPVTDGVIGPSDCADLIFAFTQNTASYESDQTEPNYGQLKSGSSDRIDIRFYHAMAQIRFCLSTNDGTYDPSYKLVSVRLKDIKSKGDCTFEGATNTFDWPKTTLDVQKDYFQTFNVSFASGTAPTGWTKGSYNEGAYNLFTNTGDVFFVIPQSLNVCEVELKIECEGSITTLTGTLPATTDLSPDVSWAAGNYYTYKISMSGESDNLSLKMTLADWAEREDYIPID